MRGRAVALVLVAALAAGCAAGATSEAEAPGRAKPAPVRAEPAVATPSPPPRRAGPKLPRFGGDVLAVTRGRTTTFMTLAGRKLGRVRGYSAWTGTRPVLGKGPRLWTLRDGRA